MSNLSINVLSQSPQKPQKRSLDLGDSVQRASSCSSISSPSGSHERDVLNKKPKLKAIDCRRAVANSSIVLSSPLSRSCNYGFEMCPSSFDQVQDAENVNPHDALAAVSVRGSITKVTLNKHHLKPAAPLPSGPLSKLPGDVLVYVAQFVVVSELISLSMVSKGWRGPLVAGAVSIDLGSSSMTQLKLPHQHQQPHRPSSHHQSKHKITHIQMSNLCNMFPRANSLTITDCKLMMNPLSKVILGRLSVSLVSLNFSDCVFMTDVFFSRILISCKNLEFLNVKGCRRVYGNVFETLVNRNTAAATTSSNNNKHAPSNPPAPAKLYAFSTLKKLMLNGTSVTLDAVQHLNKLLQTSGLKDRRVVGYNCSRSTLCTSPCERMCNNLHVCISRTPALRAFLATYFPQVVRGMKDLVTSRAPESSTGATSTPPLHTDTTRDANTTARANTQTFSNDPQAPFTSRNTTTTTTILQPAATTASDHDATLQPPKKRKRTELSPEDLLVRRYSLQIKSLLQQFRTGLLNIQRNPGQAVKEAKKRISNHHSMTGQISDFATANIRVDICDVMVNILLAEELHTLLDAPLNAFHATALMFASLTGRGQAVKALLCHGANIEATTNAPELSLQAQFAQQQQMELAAAATNNTTTAHAGAAAPSLGGGEEKVSEQALDAELLDHLDLSSASVSSNDWADDMSYENNQVPVASTEREDGGATALYAASHRGHVDIVDLLLRHNANVAAVRDSGVSSLYVAAQEGHIKVLKRLLESGAEVECRRMDGTTPLFIAAQEGHFEIVATLLRYGANPNLANNEGVTALCSAARWGHFDVVKLLLSYSACPTLSDCSGATPLYCAAQEGHFDIVSLLLKSGANVDETGKDGATPLFVASSRGHRDIVKVLLEAGASPSHAMSDGTTPIFIAAQMGHDDIISMLALSRAWQPAQVPTTRAAAASMVVNINAPRSDAVTPLLIATAAGFIKCVRLLLFLGAQPDIITMDGTSPLYLAAQEGNVEIVSALLEYGASTQINDDTGATPLHIAAHAGHVDVTKKLVERGANVLAETTGGFIPLHYAVQSGHKEIVELLLSDKSKWEPQLRKLKTLNANSAALVE